MRRWNVSTWPSTEVIEPLLQEVIGRQRPKGMDNYSDSFVRKKKIETIPAVQDTSGRSRLLGHRLHRPADGVVVLYGRQKSRYKSHQLKMSKRSHA